MDKTATTASLYRYSKEKSSLLVRMKKIEGQAKGIQRMIEDDRYCIDIIQQITALGAAADEVALLILEDHIEGCVANAVRAQNSEGHMKELMETLRKVMKRS